MPPISKNSSAGGQKGGRKARLDSTPGHERCQLPDSKERSNSGTRFSEKSLIRISDGVIGLASRSRVLGFSCAGVYFSAVVEEDGQVYFLEDIYGHDKELVGIASLRLEQLKPVRTLLDSVGGGSPETGGCPGSRYSYSQGVPLARRNPSDYEQKAPCPRYPRFCSF